MTPVQIIIRAISLLLFCAIIFAWFLPVYAFVSDGLQRDGVNYVGLIYEKDDIYTVRNGLGDFMVILNTLFSAVMVYLLFRIEKPRRKLANYCLTFFVSCWIIVKALQFLSGVMLNPPFKLLIGYQIMFVCELSFVGLLFKASKKKDNTRKPDKRLIDDEV